MENLTLVIFTVLSQTAAGAFVTLHLWDRFKGGIETTAGIFASKAIVVVMGLSLAVSSAHLGHPFEGYRAVSNIGVSWLSREIVLMGTFFAFTVLYSWQRIKGYSHSLAGFAGSIVAILAVFSSGMIYILPSHPAWNNLGPLFFFFLTAASIGPVFLTALFKIKNYPSNGEIGLIVLFAGTVLAFNFLNYLFYLSMLAGAGAELTSSYEKMVSGGIFWLRLVLGFIIPLGLYLLMYRNHRQNLALVLFLLIFIGEILGRALFYNSGAAVSMFGL